MALQCSSGLRNAQGGSMGIRIRKARKSDLKAVVALIPRLRAFGSQWLRPDDSLDHAESEAIANAITSLPEGGVVFVAESPSLAGGVAGFAYAETSTDYFTRETHGHLAIIAVHGEAEGTGVGRKLLEAVEEWSAARGYRFITLNVFAQNERARKVYERAGYSPDTLRYAKKLKS
ncbi:MAG TPA: GNAT family N-acetyltransferase [Gemmatimonadaceae bacterium]|nr:GNAT family N-acetyltransferase [Gemmatimonadaceae bacterium]